jgi:hypothetical protein
MTSEEVARLKAFLSEHPEAGDLIVGTEARGSFALPHQGEEKRGGYRVVTYYGGDDIPVFLMDVYAKGEKVNLSARERVELKKELELFAQNIGQWFERE